MRDCVKKIWKKDSGMLDQVLPLFVGILMLTIVLGLLVGTMGSIQTKNEVDLVARRAILLLETYGYIDASTEDELEQQLREIHMKDIEITTRGYKNSSREWGVVSEDNPASYGQKVEIVITGVIDASVGDMAGDTVFSFGFQRQGMPVRVSRVSTSKN